jgi:hypothetical protein
VGQIQPVTLVGPGHKGLNKEREYNLLPSDWATEALNMVLTRPGQITARNGWQTQTDTAITNTPNIDVLFEYVEKDGTVTVITAADNKIFQGISDYSVSGNDITPATTPTGDNWQFMNFNGKVVGVQSGHTPIVWDSTGDFADITASTGTLPDGPCGTSAFGRLWIVDDDLQTIRYCALLDETEWAEADGGGQIDMSNIWTLGMDKVVAISALGSNLVVFGERHIVFFGDDSGSEIGLTPTDLYVTDTMEGTGCIARDSVVSIGEGDLWYLSANGVQSLRRVVQTQNNPVETVHKTVNQYVLDLITAQRGGNSGFDPVRAIFSPQNAFYLLLLPESSRILCINTRSPIQTLDGQMTYGTTEWTFGTMPTALLQRLDGTLLLGFEGEVGKYAGNLDKTEPYSVDFFTGWLDLGEMNQYLKFLKEITSVFEVSKGVTVAWQWEYDFLTGRTTNKNVILGDPGRAEYGVSEYGSNGSIDPSNSSFVAGTDVAEYAGGLTIQRTTFPGAGQGQFIRIGFQVQVDGGRLVLQQIQLIPKIGRMAV